MQSRTQQSTAGRQTADPLLTRYLLGDLADDERDRLEDEYLSDDDAFERLVIAEDDLIDAYVRKELTPVEQEQFERVYLSSPERRERVEFARALTQVAPQVLDGLRTPADAERQAWWQRWWPFQALPRSPVLGWATASAAVALIVGATWFAIDISRLRTELGAVQADRLEAQRRAHDLSQRLDAERGRGNQLAAELQRERASRVPPQAQAVQPPVIALFTLVAGAVRGADNTPRLELAEGTEFVRFQLRIDEQKFTQYRAAIASVAGHEIWSQARLVAQSTSDGPVVMTSVAASALPSGDYILTLSGIRPNSRTEIVEEYFFRIRRAPGR